MIWFGRRFKNQWLWPLATGYNINLCTCDVKSHVAVTAIWAPITYDVIACLPQGNGYFKDLLNAGPVGDRHVRLLSQPVMWCHLTASFFSCSRIDNILALVVYVGLWLLDRLNIEHFKTTIMTRIMTDQLQKKNPRKLGQTNMRSTHNLYDLYRYHNKGEVTKLINGSLIWSIYTWWH